MGRPVGSKTRGKKIKPELGAKGVYVPSLDILIEKIGEAIHDEAKIVGIALTDNGNYMYTMLCDNGIELRDLDPHLYNSVIDVLEEVIKHAKGIS